MPHAHFIDGQRKADKSLCQEPNLSPELGEKPGSLLGQGAALGAHAYPVRAGSRAKRIPDAAVRSCVWDRLPLQGEMGFRRFGGLITTSAIPP